ncbi:MAG: acetylornithine/succinyldiaminopimelate transaminase [Burkholderiaceae bacterium]|jgi:succinylornithine transaminase family protein|nr:acetylornithine/succinyldiaminopimelate transaminase [Burkholderiaceae bacterium]
METAVARHAFDELMVPVYAPSTFIPVRGSGLDLWDQAGRRYLDMTGGIAVCALGHAHAALVDVLHDQARRLWHISNHFTNEPVLRLAKVLTEATFADKVFFCNSGAEANEAALKLARKWAHDRYGTSKTRIISCLNSFHGRTLFTVSVGGQAKYSDSFGPLPPQIAHIPYNDIQSVRAAMGEDVCAVIVEPIQGEGGVFPADVDYLRELRRLCDEKNALLIFDEIQSGMGRTGQLFAYMGYGVVPDILTSAKALGNGFPIAAMLTTESLAQTLVVGSHGTTYGGSPLSAAVAYKVLEIINTPTFLARVTEAGDTLRAVLEKLIAKYPTVFSVVRGKGLMLGLALTSAYAGQAREFRSAAEKNGLLLLVAGPDVIRLVPALIIEDKHIHEVDVLLDKSVKTWLATA